MPETDVVDRPRFADLIAGWSEATRYDSSTSRIAGHPAFGEIVAMGEAAVPLLLAELEARPAIRCLIALKTIVGSNPFPPEARGDVARMAEAWLTWGRAHGHRR